MKRRQSQTCVRSSHCRQSKLQTRKGKKPINILFEVEWLGSWCFDFIEKSIHAIVLWPPPMILVIMSYNKSTIVISMTTHHYHQRCADSHLDPRRRDWAWDCSRRPEDLCRRWGAMIMIMIMIIWTILKKVTLRMLLEPQCTGTIIISQLIVSENCFFRRFLLRLRLSRIMSSLVMFMIRIWLYNLGYDLFLLVKVPGIWATFEPWISFILYRVSQKKLVT